MAASQAGPPAIPTAHATISAALNKIADHAHSRKYVKLRLSCKELVDKLEQLLSAPDDASWAKEASAPPAADAAREIRGADPPADAGMPNAAAAAVMAVFRDAVATKRPAIACEVLDCLQKLVAHRHLRGTVSALDRPAGGEKPAAEEKEKEKEKEGDGDVPGGLGENWDVLSPQAQAVLIMCGSEDIADDGVELRVLKAVLTATTSTSLSVHGQALLHAVRACYNVFIMSRSETNQTTAKASLTQMLNVCFRRMEADSMDVEVRPIVVTDLIGITSGAGTTDAQTFVNMVVHQTFGNAEAARTAAASHINPTDTDTDGAFDGDDGEAKAEGAKAEAAGGEAGEEAAAAKSKEGGAAEEGSTGAKKGGRMAVLQKDAYLVFRALCKLSYRSGDGALDVAAGRGKILALELLKILLENAGPAFHGSEKFIGLIRQHLCLSLLKNSTGSIPQALQLSCSIFLTLLSKFRAHLKGEIGVFFPMILLKALEPGPGGAVAAPGDAGFISYDYKRVVLHCLGQQCGSGQLLIDLFVNYDCDLEGPNIFERMVLGLVRVARGHTAAADASATALAQEGNLRVQALGCLVLILQSMVEFYRSADGADGARAALAAAEAAVAEAGGLSKVSSFTGAPTGEGGSSPRDSAVASSTALDELAGSETASTTGSKLGAGARGGADALDSQRAFKKKFQEGIVLFNTKPKKGIAFLQEEGLIGTDPLDVARWLAKTQGLSKEMIGVYLGERDDMCIKVMHAYTDDIPFQGMSFDLAMRRFLEGFRLPGEAQKIDRFMEKFADAYFKLMPGPFKNADACYTLAFSTIMLNTDLHNPTIKNKMTLEGFIKNNRDINDGADLPPAFLEELYYAISNNEIKMKGDALLDGNSNVGGAPGSKQAETLFSTLLSLIPGRKIAENNEPSEEAIARTQAYLKEKAQGAQFFVSRDAETVRPMIEVAWAPMTGAFSVLFETHDELETVEPCLQGYVAAIVLTSQLGMHMLRGSFMNGLAKFTSMHNPGGMKAKHASAFKALLDVADQCGNQLHDTWPTVLRCVSKLEHLQQLHSGTPTDALLFAPASDGGGGARAGRVTDRLRARLGLASSRGGQAAAASAPAAGGPGPIGGPLGPLHTEPPPGTTAPDAASAAAEAAMSASATSATSAAAASAAAVPGPAGDASTATQPSAEVLAAVDAQDLNRMFVNSDRLDSDAIVEFVRALCEVSKDELRLVNSPRVFSLTKIVEIAHFNMSRIRLVWGRIWAVLSDYFIDVSCHANLSVAMYAVDSLRQLSMKFLERDELSNFSFQNDFLRPFVVVMRQSCAVEIRELIIRCVSQMVLARVANVKSGWKSMFMVFTTAASDEAPTIVRLAFDTIEKIVREHFNHITETETTTFTDAVNCLIAFTNNPHSLDVALNAIAFLRFCAMKLAEGSIADVEAVPQLAAHAAGTTRIKAKGETEGTSPSSAAMDPAEDDGDGDGDANGATSATERSPSGLDAGAMRFTDKEEHVYFWFPLLAGLSELTFDPRSDIRYGALEVLFDTLKYHGKAFSLEFWTRILDSVLLPIFDHVRAEFTDTTTFTDEKKRAEEDSWLYETSTQCLQHLVDLFVQFYGVVASLLPRLLELLAKFMHRSHQSLASVGVAALVRLITDGGAAMDEAMWLEVIAVIADVAEESRPDIAGLLAMPGAAAESEVSTPSAEPSTAVAVQAPSLRTGLGARRLNEVRCHAAVQLLLVQAAGELYALHRRRLTGAAAALLLNALRGIASAARRIDADLALRRRLAIRQAEDGVPEDKQLSDPPMLRLEGEASHAYLSILLHIHHMPPTDAGAADLRVCCALEDRLVELCIANLERFEATGVVAHAAAAAAAGADPPVETPVGEEGADGEGPPEAEPQTQVVGVTSAGVPVSMASVSAEHNAHAPLVVATLRALASFEASAFKRHLPVLFPLLTGLIRCEGAPPEVQRALSDLFDTRVGPLLL